MSRRSRPLARVARSQPKRRRPQPIRHLLPQPPRRPRCPSASIIIRSGRRTPKPRSCSTRGWRRHSASTTKRRSGRSNRRRRSIRMPRCLTGARRGRSGRTTTSISMTRARQRRTNRWRRPNRWPPRDPSTNALTSRRSRRVIPPMPKADRPALARAFSRAMGDLSRKYPDDLDAAVIYAESMMNLTPWKLWTADYKPATQTEQIVSVLESVLLRNPSHLGANHYYIHAVEASRNPARALPSALRLEKLAESSGHLLHMPAHIHARTGDHAAAAAANAAGAAADRRYLVSAPPNGMYGMMSLPAQPAFSRRLAHDAGTLRGCAAGWRARRRTTRPHAAMMPMVESMVVMPVSVLMRFNRHTEILALQPPPADRPVQTAWHHFARGTALAKSGKADRSRGRTEGPDRRDRGSTGNRRLWRWRVGHCRQRAESRGVIARSASGGGTCRP